MKCIAVPITANYERGDLPRHRDVRQDLVCFCRREKVDPTLVSCIFKSGFSAAFGYKFPDFFFWGNMFGITFPQGAVVLWVLAQGLAVTHAAISFSFPSQYGSALHLSPVKRPQRTTECLGWRGPQGYFSSNPAARPVSSKPKPIWLWTLKQKDKYMAVFPADFCSWFFFLIWSLNWEPDFIPCPPKIPFPDFHLFF